MEVPSLRVALESEIPEAEWTRGRFEQLNLIEEQRMKALHHTQGYQRRIAKAFHKKVKIRHVQQGDLVLKENRAPLHDPRGKFKPNWGGPYVVKEVLPGKAIKLTDLDGNDFPEYKNLNQIKRYYA